MFAQFAASGAIQFGSKLVALLSGVLLARALGAEGYGLYAFTLSTVSLTLLLCEFGMRSFLVREVSASLAHRNWPYLRSLLNHGPLVVFATGAAVGIAGALLLFALKADLAKAPLETYLLACAYLPCLALMRILVSQLSGFGLAIQAQFYENLIYPGVVVGGVAAIFFTQHGQLGPQVAMAFQTVAALATAAAIVAVLHRHRPRELSEGSDTTGPSRWVRGALPFLVLEAALVIQAQVDTQIIGWFGDEATVGRYRIAVQLAALATLGLTVLIRFAAPRIARLFASGDLAALRAYYRKLQAFSALSAGLVTLGLAAFGSWVIPAMFGAEYADAYVPLVILSLGQLGNAAFGPAGTLLLMTGDERLAARWFWTSLALNVALSPVLFHLYGAAGAAASSAAANTLNHLLCWLTARRGVLRRTATVGEA